MIKTPPLIRCYESRVHTLTYYFLISTNENIHLSIKSVIMYFLILNIRHVQRDFDVLQDAREFVASSLAIYSVNIL